MSEVFGMPVGFSDHTLGHVVTVAAVAAGARIIEKHIKLAESNTVDDFFSLNPQEFKDMVDAIRTTQVALGKVSYAIPESSKSYLNGKRSIYVSAPIKSGEKFTSENVKSVRPSFSLPTHYLPLILKARAKRNLDAGDRIEIKDLEIED
jgi:sialic acid synthase SpsE